MAAPSALARRAATLAAMIALGLSLAASGHASAAVGALVLLGLALAAVQVQHPSALATSAYGRILVAKLFLVIMLLTLAAWNRRYATPAVLAGPDRDQEQIGGLGGNLATHGEVRRGHLTRGAIPDSAARPLEYSAGYLDQRF